MSEINYQALREAAEKATWGDWDSYKPHRGARGYEVRLSSQAIAQHVLKNNAEFIAAFNPKVALALLDERERNQQYIKLRDQENEDIALTVGKLRVELDAQEIEMLERNCATRRPGRAPYEFGEYIALLIRQDDARVHGRIKSISRKRCGKCGERVPVNSCPCNGDSQCWVTKGWHETKLIV